jgi:hypothetical protein
MTTRHFLLFAAGALCAGLFSAGLRSASAAQSVLVPSPDQLHFQLVGDEPVAGPDGRTVVSGWKILVFKDRRTGDCYVAFTRGSSIAIADARPCTQ